MAQVKMQDKGFLSKQITVRNLIEDRGDIYHLFPKNYLQKNGQNNKSLYNQIANYAMTQSEINIRIKDESPKMYMSKVLEQISTKQQYIGGIITQKELEETFKQTYIPQEFINYDVNNCQEFLEKRRVLMANKIKEFYTGL